MRKLFLSMVLVGLAFAGHVASATASPKAASQPIVSPDNVFGGGYEASEPVAQQPLDFPKDGNAPDYGQVFPQRVAERGAAKLGAAVGLTIGGGLGYAVLGTPGAALFGAVGALFGEVFGEIVGSSFFNQGRVPYAPRMISPLVPTR